MEFDKEFRIPFRQTTRIVVTGEAGNQYFVLKDYSRWGAAIAADTRAPTALGLLGQTDTDDNCPQLQDVYSQLVNYEYCKIHAVNEEFRVVDYEVRGSGTTVALSRNSPHFTRDPSAQLLWKLTTNGTEESRLLTAAAVDGADFMRALAHTRRGTSFTTRLPTEMKMMRGQAGRLLLSWTGREATPNITINGSILSNNANNLGPTGSSTASSAFNIRNTSAGSGIVDFSAHRSNIFYWGKGQIYNMGGQCDVNNYQSKYYMATATPYAILPSNEARNDISFPRIFSCTPLIESVTAFNTERVWKIQNITTLIVKARGYVPTKALSSLKFETQFLSVNDDDEPMSKQIKLIE
ncbi:coat protein [Lake Sarah-associated circular virus-32]|uniref:coat protein n=1 Tax=Lake Sarah-associated circular virus-32 TaxID=1685760 RepID=UPI0007779983|nr:coat protein [Lake Sarah-associated circular virus-32]ALE29722.1 coat protein [Lake Sarah-associated circular virus-32]ALE29723.1 coat protein [Lake Sarah-associated circular virus-32]ALE29726.1 coat protein [Lake Sarah-associated circular virus-32]ALE29727.1 coat protein [Lake Sarah-associated circular virus-32]